jgi:hypothetical protein
VIVVNRPASNFSTLSSWQEQYIFLKGFDPLT